MRQALAGSLDHDHVFLGAAHRRNERRTWAVLGVCLVMMGVEVGGGFLFHSMALMAEGLHMAAHVGALAVAAIAYAYARRYAHDPRFVFGTGKVGDLAGFANAVGLGLMAILIAFESIGRLFDKAPVEIDGAIPIAGLGLLVSLVSAWLLRDEPLHAEAHDHGHAHDHDLNIRAAYVHVLTDAFVAAIAIVGLLAAKQFGWPWLDAATGLIGAAVVAQFALALLRNAASVLLDRSPEPKLMDEIRNLVEADDVRIADLHVWRIGPGRHAAIVSLAAANPEPPEAYKARLASVKSLSHITVEVRPRSA